MDEKELNENEEYISVSVLREEAHAQPDSGKYGIFGFLADNPIFCVSPESGNAETKRTAAKKDVAEVQEREAVETVGRESGELYDMIYLFGLQILRRVRWVGRKIKAILRRPAHVIAVFASIFLVFFDKVALRSFHNAFQDFKKLRKDAKKSLNNLHRSFDGKPVDVFKRLLTYPGKAMKHHPHFFKTAFNTALPVVALVVLVVTVGAWTGSTYALEVIVENNGEQCSIGYISDESVFIEARNIVKDRIDSGVSADETLISNPTYKITRVDLNQLSDADTISDKLIENSDSKLVSACGVYIDGDFVCAVKNETDARSVFDNILEEAEKKYKISDTDENSFADFVEEVEFVQGLYSDDEEKMWEASHLLDTLENEKKSAAVYYTVKDGDTPSEVAQSYDISTAQLMAYNPGVNFDVFKTDTKLVVSQEVNFVRVQIKKVVEKTVETAYSTESEYSSSLFKGDKRVKRKGVKGTDKVTYLVTYVDGMQTGSREIDRVTLTEPVSEKVQIGTKSTTVYGSSYGSYTISAKGKFVWPVPGVTTISSPYGYRSSGFHTGIDISNGRTSGRVVVAAESGKVEMVKFSHKSYGNQIIINHGNGVKTRYAHLLDGSISVSVGQKVSRGQAIARVGSTGNSSGPHLHFEVIVNGNTVNPQNYVKR